MSYQRGRLKVQRRLLRDYEAGAAARRELDQLREVVDHTDLEIVALLMSELIANSVKHSGPDAGEHVLLELTVTRDRIRVEVRDRGPGFVPERRPVGQEIGLHWGLELIDRLADRWQVVPGCGRDDTSIWFELDRGRARAHEAVVGF
jgi:anti-sigma regulatory factor (Ser/Thr protein kinase)